MMAEDEEVALFVEALVGKLAEQLKPGMGPMVIPAEVAAAAAEFQNYRTTFPLAPGYDYHDLRLETCVKADGGIVLTLTWHGGQRVWEGVLRPGTWPAPPEGRKPA